MSSENKLEKYKDKIINSLNESPKSQYVLSKELDIPYSCVKLIVDYLINNEIVKYKREIYKGISSKIIYVSEDINI